MQPSANLNPANVSNYRNISLINTGQLIKGNAGQISHIHVSNVNAAARFLKLYDKATAPTTGTDIPFRTIVLHPTSSQYINYEPEAIPFTLGIGISATTAVADADNGAPSANDVVVNIGYK